MDNIKNPFSDVEIDRRGLIKGAGAATLSLAFGGLLTSSSKAGTAADVDILGVAKIAEALATTMYTGIINESPFFAALDPDDQDYFRAARDEEKFHYDLIKSATGNVDAGTTYFFPAAMFTSTKTTLNTLIKLEDIFIAAYQLGVYFFSSNELKLLSAQILGVESAHRTLGRLIAAELGRTEVAGASGLELSSPPNNNVYERLHGINTLDRAVNQVLGYINPTEAARKGYTTVRTFDPSYVPAFPGLRGNPPETV